MSRWARARERLSVAREQEGLSGATAMVIGYLAWKLRGSPTGGEDDLTDRLDRAEAATLVLLVRDWYETANPATAPLVTVILPTRDREDLLSRAVDSVVSQTYQNWELILVDDSDRGSPLPAESLADERTRSLVAGGVGIGAARNLGLDAAAGDFVAFLDDDNVMDRNWLKSVVLTFEEYPDADVMIGAQVVWPEPGATDPHQVRFPLTFDWHRLTQANYVDMGMLAHRSQADVRFDETLPAFVDWDYVVRLTRDQVPVLAPASSGIYFTGASGRISYQDRQHALKTLQERFDRIAPSAPTAEKSSDRFDAADRAALVSLVRRRKTIKQREPDVLVVGDTHDLTDLSGHLSEHAGARIENRSEIGPTPPETRYDIVLVDGRAPDEVAEVIQPDGLIIGMNAHRHQYETVRLGFARRIGDKLWMGSKDEIDLELLFDGSTLVKLGVPAERGDQS